MRSEIHFGEFEGRSYDDIAAEYPDLYRQWMEHPAEVHFPGGESLKQMWTLPQRDGCCRDSSPRLQPHKSIALVTHGGVIRILLAEALGLPPANIFRIGQCYGAINRIRYVDGVPLVDLVNLRPESIEKTA